MNLMIRTDLSSPASTFDIASEDNRRTHLLLDCLIFPALALSYAVNNYRQGSAAQSPQEGLKLPVKVSSFQDRRSLTFLIPLHSSPRVFLDSVCTATGETTFIQHIGTFPCYNPNVWSRTAFLFKQVGRRSGNRCESSHQLSTIAVDLFLMHEQGEFGEAVS